MGISNMVLMYEPSSSLNKYAAAHTSNSTMRDSPMLRISAMIFLMSIFIFFDVMFVSQMIPVMRCGLFVVEALHNHCA